MAPSAAEQHKNPKSDIDARYNLHQAHAGTLTGEHRRNQKPHDHHQCTGRQQSHALAQVGAYASSQGNAKCA